MTMNTPVSRLLHRLAAGLPEGPTVRRAGAAVVAGAIAVWAAGLALTLFVTVLVGSLALAAAVAAMALVAGLLARHKPALARAAAAAAWKHQPVRSMD